VSQSRRDAGEQVLLLKRVALVAGNASAESALPERIVVRIPPDQDGWNRLQKADRSLIQRRTRPSSNLAY
jgi:hypothetical protein